MIHLTSAGKLHVLESTLTGEKGNYTVETNITNDPTWTSIQLLTRKKGYNRGEMTFTNSLTISEVLESAHISANGSGIDRKVYLTKTAELLAIITMDEAIV
jgi:hypothetical protein